MKKYIPYATAALIGFHLRWIVSALNGWSYSMNGMDIMMAATCSCSHGIVRKWVSETDVPVRRYGAHVYPEDIREEILKAHHEGLSLRDIKRGFGCAPQTVISWEKKNRS